MSAPAAITPAVVADTTTTTTVINGIIDGANWAGRQTQWLYNTICEYAVSAFNFAKPYFASLTQFISEQFEKIRKFTIENKEIIVGIMLATMFSNICGCSSDSSTA